MKSRRLGAYGKSLLLIDQLIDWFIGLPSIDKLFN